tara:strand:+ start:11016 stop:12167 length:1152 start_codon:yes stop_codon:yes gene_type:complete
MTLIHILRFLLFIVFLNSSQAYAQESFSVGGDVYLGGSKSSYPQNVQGDIFVSGFAATLDVEVEEDAHIAGFDVEVENSVGKDLYAAGLSVSIESSVGEDVTASGFNVRLKRSASVGKNTRIAAGKVTIDAPLSGSLVAAGGDIVLNSSIKGDVRITGAQISFGQNAKILGTLKYSSPEEVEVPASVISSDRVQYTKLSASGMFDDLNEAIDGRRPPIWAVAFSIISVFLITLALFLTIAAVFIAFKPEMVEGLRSRASDNPGKSFLFGLLGMAILYGSVPVSATTIVGLPLIPLIILAIVIFWTLGYLLGTYVIFWRVAGSMGVKSEKIGTKLLVIGCGLIILAMINFIPIVGWLANLVVVLIGIGSITILMLRRSSTIRTI